MGQQGENYLLTFRRAGSAVAWAAFCSSSFFLVFPCLLVEVVADVGCGKAPDEAAVFEGLVTFFATTFFTARFSFSFSFPRPTTLLPTLDELLPKLTRSELPRQEEHCPQERAETGQKPGLEGSRSTNKGEDKVANDGILPTTCD